VRSVDREGHTRAAPDVMSLKSVGDLGDQRHPSPGGKTILRTAGFKPG
jgi:hypothetical protein